MLRLLSCAPRGEEGVVAIEYGLIAALIGLAIIVSLGHVGSELRTVFDTISDQLRLANSLH